MHIKLAMQSERLERYKKRSLFAYRATENSLDALAATLIKRKNENNLI